jgi:hypothetical protein
MLSVLFRPGDAAQGLEPAFVLGEGLEATLLVPADMRPGVSGLVREDDQSALLMPSRQEPLLQLDLPDRVEVIGHDPGHGEVGSRWNEVTHVDHRGLTH